MLIAVQVALSTLLLVSTTLFLRSLWAASQIDPGFEIHRVVTIEADTRSQQMSEAETAAYYRDALARLKGLPEVTGVSAAAVVPLSLDVIVNGLTVDRGGQEQHVKVSTNIVLPDYFRVMGIPLLRGRDLTETDRQATPRAVIVNETFARQVFPGENAIGQRVRRPGPPDKAEPWAEIVGVAADSRYMTLGEQTQPQVYWPFAPAASGMKLHVRTEGDAGGLARAIPEALRSVGGPPVSVRARPLRDVMAVALFPAQAAATVLAALGLVGWALTVAGIYGVVSYGVTRRIPELGLRLAGGAPPSNVRRLLLRDGVAVTLAGLVVGLAAAAAAAPQLATFLAGVSPHDAVSFAAVAGVFLATAVTASYGPARRGTRLSPIEALRRE
jgi:predicted permease